MTPIWVLVVSVFAVIVGVWLLYKLFVCLRYFTDDSRSKSKSLESIGTTRVRPGANLNPDTHLVQMNQDGLDYDSLPTIKSALREYQIRASAGETELDNSLETASKQVQSRYMNQRKRYIENGEGKGNNDKVLQDSLMSNKSLASNKSIREMKSYSSRKSTGFEPSINREALLQTVEPLKGQRTSSFLEILNKLNELEGDDEEERKERERKRRRREERELNSISSINGIDANSSDETASQTFIGKPPDARPDPGRIKLGLIRAQETIDLNSSLDKL